MADERDAAQAAAAAPAAAQADLELADREAGDVKGGMAYRSEGAKKKKKKSVGGSGGSASAKPM